MANLIWIIWMRSNSTCTCWDCNRYSRRTEETSTIWASRAIIAKVLEMDLISNECSPKFRKIELASRSAQPKWMNSECKWNKQHNKEMDKLWKAKSKKEIQEIPHKIAKIKYQNNQIRRDSYNKKTGSRLMTLWTATFRYLFRRTQMTSLAADSIHSQSHFQLCC